MSEQVTTSNTSAQPSSKRSDQAATHMRTLATLRKSHPEVRQLAGANPYTILCVVLVACIHWATIWVVSRTNLLTVFCVALLFGQVLMHATGTLVHENGHGLIFRRRGLKVLCNALLEAVMASFGRTLQFQHDHVYGHHPHLGDYKRDWEHPDALLHYAQVRLWYARPLLARSLKALRLAIHLLPYGFVVETVLAPPVYRRLTGLPTVDVSRELEVKPVNKWELRLSILISIGTLITVYSVFGGLGLLYQIWSLSIFQSNWAFTLGGQYRSEHEGDNAVQPTRSDRGFWGRLLFNTGYHHEHHVYPLVPWNRLPRLSAIAPEIFNVETGPSYLTLWWRELWDESHIPRRSPTVITLLEQAKASSSTTQIPVTHEL